MNLALCAKCDHTIDIDKDPESCGTDHTILCENCREYLTEQQLEKRCDNMRELYEDIGKRYPQFFFPKWLNKAAAIIIILSIVAFGLRQIHWD